MILMSNLTHPHRAGDTRIALPVRLLGPGEYETLILEASHHQRYAAVRFSEAAWTGLVYLATNAIDRTPLRSLEAPNPDDRPNAGIIWGEDCVRGLLAPFVTVDRCRRVVRAMSDITAAASDGRWRLLMQSGQLMTIDLAMPAPVIAPHLTLPLSHRGKAKICSLPLQTMRRIAAAGRDGVPLAALDLPNFNLQFNQANALLRDQGFAFVVVQPKVYLIDFGTPARPNPEGRSFYTTITNGRGAGRPPALLRDRVGAAQPPTDAAIPSAHEKPHRQSPNAVPLSGGLRRSAAAIMKDHPTDLQARAIIEAFVSARRARNMTHQDLASQTGLHASAINLIELGQRQPTLGAFLRICAALRLDAAGLVVKTGGRG
jgi:DNA-binding XRE family transcriptional regulator